MRVQLQAPQNWQDFETLCASLYSRKFNDPNLQRFGRQGQQQHGVDIYSSTQKFAIQCKQKNLGNTLSEDEINNEIELVKKSPLEINRYYIATTAQRDARLQELVSQLSTNELNIYVISWDDIVEHLYQYPEILNSFFPSTSNNPNDIYFDFWYKRLDIKNLQINANYLPFHAYDIKFSRDFLKKIGDYLSTHNDFFDNSIASNSNEKLINNIKSFNQTLNNVFELFYEYKEKNIYDNNSQLEIYRVNVDALDYHEMNSFYEPKKIVLRRKLYELIAEANIIIATWNNLSQKHQDFIGFCEYEEILHQQRTYTIYPGVS